MFTDFALTTQPSRICITLIQVANFNNYLVKLRRLLTLSSLVLIVPISLTPLVSYIQQICLHSRKKVMVLSYIEKIYLFIKT